MEAEKNKPLYIHYQNNLKHVPLRRHFVDKAASRVINRRIKAGETVPFMPNHIIESPPYEKYHVKMFGVLHDGRKTAVILRNIPVFFDVLVPDDRDPREFADGIKCSLEKEDIGAIDCDIVESFPLLNFQQYPNKYARLFFDSMQDRTRALNKVIEWNMPTVNDDEDSGNLGYFNKVAREFKFNTANWNTIPTTDHTSIEDKNHPVVNCEYCFNVDVREIIPVSEQQIEEIEFLRKDRTMVMTWDIETHTFKNPNGKAPQPTDDNYRVNMICMTFHWHYTNDALMKVCIMDYPCKNDIDIFYDEDMLAERFRKEKRDNPEITIDDVRHMMSQKNVIIECGNEKNILRAFIEVCRRMAPDILVSFNGGGFDWPIVRQKMYDYGLMREMKAGFSALPLRKSQGKYGDSEENIFKWAFKRYKIKIAAGDYSIVTALNLPGIIDTDCMIVFKQLYTRDEVAKGQSLNFYLKINGMKGKQDLPYERMVKYVNEVTEWVDNNNLIQSKMFNFLADKYHFDSADSRDIADFVAKHRAKEDKMKDMMAEIAKYCSIDAFRCQQLYVKRTIKYDKAELCNMAYMSLLSGFFYANGVKVENLVGAYCASPRFNIVFSSRTSDNRKVKYPGAVVFDPIRGLAMMEPIVGVDFRSLYPSLMMTYNISPEMTIDYKSQKDLEYAKSLKDQGYILHYIDFTGHIDEKDAPDDGAPVRVRGWTVRHSNIIDPAEDKPDFSLFGYDEEDQKYVTEVIPDLSELEASEEYRELFLNAKPDPSHTPRTTGLQNERMGVFPFILKKLFNKRATVKVPFEAIGKLIEKIDALREENIAGGLDEYNFDKLKDEDFKNTGFTRDNFTYEDLKFKHAVLDSKQKALKVYMNTFYGVEGFYISKLHKLLAAGAVTTTGQYNIKLVANYIRMNDYKLWYGDSVTGDTPILVRWRERNGNAGKSHKYTLGYKYISEIISQESDWRVHADHDSDNSHPKEIAECDYEVWTDRGFTDIRKVIRHKTDKKIYRVITPAGCVDVTEDHSLLDENAEKITPKQCSRGTELLHARLPNNDAIIALCNTEVDDRLYKARIYMKKLFAKHRDDVFGMISADKKKLAEWYFAVGSLGYYTKIVRRKRGIVLFCSKNPLVNPLIACNISHIYEITDNYLPDYSRMSQYVYDLETENHHFSAGVGQIIVHNTDSNYVSCPKTIFDKCDKVYDECNEKVGKLINKYDCAGITTRDIRDEHRATINKLVFPECERFRAEYELLENDYKKTAKNITGDKAKYSAMKQFNAIMAEKFATHLKNMYDVFTEFISGLAEDDPNIRYFVKFFKFCIKEEYHIQIVQITRRDIDIRGVMINEFLMRNNGTKYLKMAYEEVLNGTLLAGKKKYAGMEHKDSENFHPKKLFIRGLDFIKQGQPELSKTIGLEILHEALSIENEDELINICERKLAEIYDREWNLDYFILRKKYDPSKKNVPVLRFVERMREQYDHYCSSAHFDPEMQALYEPPEMGERFPYIMIKKDQDFTPTGNKITAKNGDRMEFVRVYKHFRGKPEEMEIDLGYYIEANIIGLLSRFISYHPRFQPTDGAAYTYDDLDSYTISAASKYLKEINAKLSGVDRKYATKVGARYRTIAGNINKLVYNDSMRRHPAGIFYLLNHKIIALPEYKDSAEHNSKYYYYNQGAKNKAINDTINNIAVITARKCVENKGDDLLESRIKILRKDPNYICDLLDLYNDRGNSIPARINRYIRAIAQEKSQLLMCQLRDIVPKVVTFMRRRNRRIQDFTVRIREELFESDDYDNPRVTNFLLKINKLSESEHKLLMNMYETMTKLQSMQLLIDSKTKMFLAIVEMKQSLEKINAIKKS